jgi:hypothetical protein
MYPGLLAGIGSVLFNGNVDGFFDGNPVFIGELIGERVDTAESGRRGVNGFSLASVLNLTAMSGYGVPLDARALCEAEQLSVAAG